MKEPLLSLASDELRSLAAALEAGRLSPPYSAIALQRFVSQAVAGGVADGLTELTAVGCSSKGIAKIMELLSVAIDRRPRLEQMVDLVATGPDEPAGTARAPSVVVGDLFRDAKKSVVVCGYAVRQGQKVFRDLADRMAERPSLQVRLYLGCPAHKWRYIDARRDSPKIFSSLPINTVASTATAARTLFRSAVGCP